MKHTILVNSEVLACNSDWMVEHLSIDSLFELKVLLKHTVNKHGQDRVKLLREVEIQLEDLKDGL